MVRRRMSAEGRMGVQKRGWECSSVNDTLVHGRGRMTEPK